MSFLLASLAGVLLLFGPCSVALGQGFDESSYATFRKQLTDADPGKRLIAAHKLLEAMADEAVAEALRKKVSSYLLGLLTSEKTPASVLLSLLKAVSVDSAPAFTPQVLDLIHHPNAAIRAGALGTLAELRDKRIADLLKARFSDESLPTHRRVQAVQAVKTLGLWSIGPLIDVLESPSRPVRVAALTALETLTGYAWGRDHATWKAWWHANRTASEPAILRAAIARKAEDTRRRVIKLIDPKSLSQNLDALRGNRDEAVLLAVLKNLEALKDRKAVEPLSSLLETEHRVSLLVKCTDILGSLLRREDKEGGRILVNLLGRANGHTAVKVAVIRAMGKIGDVDGVDFVAALSPLLSGRNPRLKGLAAESIGKIGRNDKAVVTKLLALLDAPEIDVRRAAAKALGEIRAVPAVNKLIDRLADADPNVRWCVVSSLALIGDGKACAPLSARLSVEKEPRILEMILDALVQLKASMKVRLSVVAFIKKDPSSRLAAKALEGLLQLAGKDARALEDTASLLMKEGLRAAAARVYEGLRKAFPKKGPATARKLGDIYAELGQTGQAFEAYLEALVSSESGTALEERARAMIALHAKKDRAGAAAYHVRLAARLPSAAATLWPAVLALFGQAGGGAEKKRVARAVAGELKAAGKKRGLALSSACARLLDGNGKDRGLAAHAFLTAAFPGPKAALSAASPPKAWNDARAAWLSWLAKAFGE